MLRESLPQRAEGPADDDGAVRLLEQLGALDATCPPEQADLLAAALHEAVQSPTAALGDALRAQLAREELSHLRLTDGRPLRSALVAAQQALGFPWALEIDPSDLWRLRSDSSPHLGLRFALAISALISAAWSVGWALALAPQTLGQAALTAALGVGALHGGAACVEAIAFCSPRRLRWLSQACLVVPAALLVAVFWSSGEPWRLLMIALAGGLAAPTLVTALLCAALADRLAPT